MASCVCGAALQCCTTCGETVAFGDELYTRVDAQTTQSTEQIGPENKAAFQDHDERQLTLANLGQLFSQGADTVLNFLLIDQLLRHEVMTSRIP